MRSLGLPQYCLFSKHPYFIFIFLALQSLRFTTYAFISSVSAVTRSVSKADNFQEIEREMLYRNYPKS